MKLAQRLTTVEVETNGICEETIVWERESFGARKAPVEMFESELVK